MTVTTKAVGNGYHDIYWHGKKIKHFGILNGSAGVSGRGPNNYMIYKKGGSVISGVRPGSLTRLKKVLHLSFTRKEPITIEEGVHEDVAIPTNNMSSGNVAGAGTVGPKAANKYRAANKKNAPGAMFKRKTFKEWLGDETH